MRMDIKKVLVFVIFSLVAGVSLLMNHTVHAQANMNVNFTKLFLNQPFSLLISVGGIEL